MIPLGETLRMRLPSTMNRLPAPSTATPPQGRLQFPRVRAALVAGPPSPEYSGLPLPATVVMIPLGEILRMRLLRESAMNRLPAPSTAGPTGEDSCAPMAGLPSP